MWELDLLFGSLNSFVGSTALVIIMLFILLTFLLMMSRLPLYFAMLAALPALLGIARSGLPSWSIGLILTVLGLLFAMVALRMYSDASAIW
jgi:hypothetical protein